jgi:hypothetical protein
MKRPIYPTDLTGDQWDHIKDLIPPEKPGGRHCGQDMIIMVNSTSEPQKPGCAWASENCQLSRIVADTCQEYDWQGSSLLSLSAYFNGKAFFNINGGRQAVGDGSYIIVNHAQQVAFTIDSETMDAEARACRLDLVSRAARSLSSRHQAATKGHSYESIRLYRHESRRFHRARQWRPRSPGLIIHTPSEVWPAISRGELDAQQAFMQGHYRVEGDFSVLIKMSRMFAKH